MFYIYFSLYLLTFMIVRDQVIKMIQRGNFSGQVFKPGLESYKEAPGEGIIYIAPFHELENSIPNDVKIKFNQLKEGIINGNISIYKKRILYISLQYS